MWRGWEVVAPRQGTEALNLPEPHTLPTVSLHLPAHLYPIEYPL
jgi:hypothetical protein